MFFCLTIIILAGCAFLFSDNRTTDQKIVNPKIKIDIQQKAKVESKEDFLVKKINLATVGKGEGIEHAFIRQLIANPAQFGFEGYVSNTVLVKKWAQKEAHKIAICAGFFDWKFGGEIRVRKSDTVAYVLSRNTSGISVEEFVKGDNGFSQYAQDIQEITDSYTQAKFLAHEDEAGNFVASSSYEYFQLPITQQ
ncbi:MAG: hypothetical protein AAB446_01125 [Patescibacteria group bacterium]